MVVRAPRSMLTTSSMVQAIIVGTFSIHAAIDTLRARAEALPELGSAALGGFLEPPPLQPLDHTSISQMRKDLEAAHQKQLHAKGDHSP